MTVKEVFDLRKQGRIEEAYEAIRPMYAAHKGRYTTLCMFWTAADVFKLRLDQKRVEEAEKILEALKRMLPQVEAITKQLDSERPMSKPTEKPAENRKPLPWEKGETKTEDDQNKAAAFIASATRRLAKAQKTEKKSSPVRATDGIRLQFSILNFQFPTPPPTPNPPILNCQLSILNCQLSTPASSTTTPATS